MSQIMMTFPGGKHKVLTMSYDDGTDHDKKLVEIFNATNIKGTFHLNSGLLGANGKISKEEVERLYKGHEVSTHTVTHPTIERSPRERIVEEFVEDRKSLEQLVGYPVRGTSYPNGSFNSYVKEILPHLGIEYARTVHSTGNFWLPDDFLAWNPTCHHNQDLMEKAEQFVSLNKKQYLNLFYVWGHSFEFERDQNWQVIEDFCAYVGNRDDILYATNIEIVDYINAFRHLKFAADSQFVYNPSAQSVWLSVDEKIVEVKGGQQVDL
ncbi:polysaccharide deacetylase family protein [Aquibacillus koreensis]|uniref:Polysaccharide deacetylase family protein n=1 Tax=Aquibacillus koreensis TaxID=279446 RepID=A0A9X3WIB2_9BACI|nr:polysaccharide deacetylase family protein [Aquibacillus koreensis]MCT2536037.1 polysaccharide deacetylase family protein [Aquibacillus koreensis]MDC3420492.1 polysaccharide deacetylase family protein [Aquibacillus koreensis]